MARRQSKRPHDKSIDTRLIIRRRLDDERGTLNKGGGLRVALLYPSPYHVGMSSLGFQTIYRIINTQTDHTAERVFLPDDPAERGPLLMYESLAPAGDADLLAVSLAYELEIVGLIDCLERAGLEPLARDRQPSDPIVVLGGPITFSNPLPVSPFADLIVMGEAESAIVEVLDAIATAESKSALLEQLAARPGYYVPTLHGEQLMPVLKADDSLLPAFSQIVTPNTELSDMHLVEAERGCHRRCTFCVMRRSTNGGMRIAEPDRILATIPDFAQRVGLVGAAVTDHPKLLDIVRAIVDRGLGLGISSLRADRLTPELVELLCAGGYRTLTVAADGASERLRKSLQKAIRARHLIHAAKLAADAGMQRLKLYMMLGVPDETDDDLVELVELLAALCNELPVAVALSPFVSKRNTPLDGLPYAGVDIVERRTQWLRDTVRSTLEGRAEIRTSSARWAWVEHCLAQGGFEMAHAALRARRNGGKFSDWKAAVRLVAPRFSQTLRVSG